MSWVQTIWSLENEREARGQEATEAAQRHAQALEEVKLRDMAAADLQKKVTRLIHRLIVLQLCCIMLCPGAGRGPNSRAVGHGDC